MALWHTSFCLRDDNSLFPSLVPSYPQFQRDQCIHHSCRIFVTFKPRPFSAPTGSTQPLSCPVDLSINSIRIASAANKARKAEHCGGTGPQQPAGEPKLRLFVRSGIIPAQRPRSNLITLLSLSINSCQLRKQEV